MRRGLGPRASGLGLILTASLAPALAVADPACPPLVDPVPLGVRDAAFDAQRGACLGPEMSARVVGLATIDTPNFYGTLGGGLVLGARFLPHHRVEVGVSARAVDYTFAQDAVVIAHDVRFGPVIAHAAIGGPIAMNRDARWAAVLAWALPLTTADMDLVETAAQAAVVASVRATPRWTAHARAALLGGLARSDLGTTTRGAFLVGGDAIVRATGWLGIGLGADAQAGWRGGFDHLLVRAGFRFAIGERWRIELGAGAPLGGEERANAAVTLGVARSGD